MSERSGISWTDASFSPWFGCTKVSAACDHCYAEAWTKRSRVRAEAQPTRALLSRHLHDPCNNSPGLT